MHVPRTGDRGNDYIIALGMLELSSEECGTLSIIHAKAIEILGATGAARLTEQMVFAIRDAHVEDEVGPRDHVLTGVVRFTENLLIFRNSGYDYCVPRPRLEAIHREYTALRPALQSETTDGERELVPAG